MTRLLLVVGWVLLALEAAALVAMGLGRGMSSESSGRALGRDVALLAAPVLVAAAALLVLGQRNGSRGLVLAGTLVVALPFLLLVAGVFSDAGSGLLRAVGRGREGRFPEARLTAIARAVDRGDPAAAAAAIRGRALDFSARERAGSTILGYAVKKACAWPAPPGRTEIVRALLEAGAPVVDGAVRPDEPLVAVVADSADPRTTELLDLLLAHGGDPDAKLPFDPDPLLFSRNLICAKAEVLLRRGARTSALSTDGAQSGWTPLMRAVEREAWDLALCLVRAGVPAAAAAPDGETARSLAERSGRAAGPGDASGTADPRTAFLAALGEAEAREKAAER